MTVLNKELFDSAISLGLDLNRVDASTSRKIIKILKRMERELIALLSVDELTAFSKRRVQKQLAEAKKIINDYYAEITNVNLDATKNVALSVANETAGSLAIATGGAMAGVGVLPTTAFMETIAGTAIIQGAVQADWWKRQSADTVWRFNNAVRQGLVAAETTPQIIKRVRETIDVSRRNAESLVRTSIMTVSNDTRQSVFENHADIIKSLEWVATLDGRTCPRCAVRDGKRWTLIDKKPINHSIPFSRIPIHFNDRCVMVPVTKTFKELGININEFDDNVRASIEGQITDKTFEDFMKRKGRKFTEEILGKGRADLYLNKKITFEQLIDGRGNELTLHELTAKYVK